MFRRLIVTLALAASVDRVHAETAAPEAPATPAASPAASAAKLTVGSPAPALKPAKWLKGEPVTAFENDKTYLIECWATWCTSCIAAIPHINALHQKYQDKGLVVIGMNMLEDSEEKAAAFVKKKGDGMAYRVAFDGKPGDTAENWLHASGHNGIPDTFIVRDGKLLWHGHPGALNDAMVESMLAGKFDPAQGEKASIAREDLQKEIYESINRVSALEQARKFDEATAMLDATEKQAGPEWDYIIGMERGRIIVAKGDPGAAKFLIALATSMPDNGRVQADVATKLLNAPELKDQRDPKAAKECIARMLANYPGNPMALLLDAQADHALGDKAASEKTLTSLTTITGKDVAPLIAKANAALEAVKAGKEWPAAK